MKERPILFSGPMVRAILEGRKTMTRRVVKAQPNVVDGLLQIETKKAFGPPESPCSVFRTNSAELMTEHLKWIPCPYGHPGDRMWVRETFGIFDSAGNERTVGYRADGDDGPGTWLEVPEDKYFNDDYFPADERWRPSIHMPRWASRITIEITDVRVERVQEIGIEDCQKEGISDSALGGKVQEGYVPQTAFADLWNSINGKTHPWDSNPWVWVISFNRIG